MKISEWVKDLRQREALSQKDLSKKLGVSEITICYIESGRRTPGFRTIRKLSDFSGLSVVELQIMKMEEKNENYKQE